MLRMFYFRHMIESGVNSLIKSFYLSERSLITEILVLHINCSIQRIHKNSQLLQHLTFSQYYYLLFKAEKMKAKGNINAESAAIGKPVPQKKLFTKLT